MRLLLSAVAGLSLLSPLPAAAAPEDLGALASSQLPGLLAAYKDLHSRPELFYREEKTAGWITSRLREEGFEVTERVGRYDDPKKTSYGAVAVLKNGPGPTLLLRTELDALPVTEKTGLEYASAVRAKSDSGEDVGVMHACGHDVHLASLWGAARLLAGMKGRWRGTLVLVAEPAEEVGAGARALLADGLYKRFPRPDFAFTLHSSPTLEAGKIGYREGAFFANAYGIDITVRGRGGHGAAPHLAKDPVVLASQLVLALQTAVSRENNPIDPAVLTVGSIHGGSKGNVIPEEVRLQLSLRSYKTEVADRLIASTRRIAKGLAAAAGLPEELYPVVDVKDQHTPAIFNDPALSRRLAGTFKALFGESNVVETDPVMLADDFARYGLDDGKILLAMFWLGTVDPAKARASASGGPPLPALHSAEFAPSAGPAIRTGVQALAAAALELLKP